MASIKNKILGMFQGTQVSTGIDIGTHSIKVVQIAHKESGPILTGAGIHILKPDTILNNEIKNRDDLLQALTQLIHRVDPSGKVRDVIFSLPWSWGVIADRVHLKKTNKQESDEDLILMEAGQRSPFDVDDITLDYKILTRDPATGDMEVLLVAAKNQIMQTYISLLHEANLRPVIIDVDAFAAANGYLHTAADEDQSRTIAVINIGDHITNITFIRNGSYQLTRDISTACDFFIRTLMKNLKVEKDEATKILKGETDVRTNPSALQRSIDYSAEELSVGIDLTINYYQSLETNAKVDKMVLCGGGACIPNLPAILAKRHDVDVEISAPIQKIAYDESKFSSPIPENQSTILAVATGLALRRL